MKFDNYLKNKAPYFKIFNVILTLEKFNKKMFEVTYIYYTTTTYTYLFSTTTKSHRRGGGWGQSASMECSVINLTYFLIFYYLLH